MGRTDSVVKHLHELLASACVRMPIDGPYLRVPFISSGFRWCIQAMIFSLILVHGFAYADTVQLKNGDPIRGKILSMEGESLKLDTDFAGVVYIDWEDIARIESDRPLTLIFESSAEIPDGVGVRDGDRLVVFHLDADGPIPFSNVKEINPAELYYRGNVSLGGNQTTGNSETQAVNLSGSFTLRLDRQRLQMNAKLNRGEAQGKSTAENASGNFRYEYYLNRQIFVIGDELLEHDRFQNLNLRSTSTIGLGYDFIDRKSHTISLGGGPTMVYEDFSSQPATVVPAATWIISWYREFHKGDVKLYHKHQGFQDFGNSSAFRLNADQGIRVEVWNDFSLNLEYHLRFNSDPAPGRKELDTTFIFGVSYEIES